MPTGLESRLTRRVLLVDTGLVRSGDFSGAQLDPSLSGFWLAGEQAVLIGGTCQWQTRAVRLIP